MTVARGKSEENADWKRVQRLIVPTASSKGPGRSAPYHPFFFIWQQRSPSSQQAVLHMHLELLSQHISKRLGCLLSGHINTLRAHRTCGSQLLCPAIPFRRLEVLCVNSHRSSLLVERICLDASVAKHGQDSFSKNSNATPLFSTNRKAFRA